MTVNGISYELIKRSDKVAVFSVQGGRRFEVVRIYVLPKRYDAYWLYHWPEREEITRGSQFGRDGSRMFFEKEQALKYFDKLNQSLGGELTGQ